MFVFSLAISHKFVSLGGVDLTENGISLEGSVRSGNQLVSRLGASWQT